MTRSASYLAAGATCLVAGQAFVNLGAVLSMLPLTGVPLPLISVGGSSLVVMLALVGVMLNVADSESGAAAKAKPRSEVNRCQSQSSNSSQQPPSRVLIAAGGTAGHVVPALAVADELRDRGAEVEFAGGRRIESRMVPEAGYPLHRFEVRGFERRLSPALARSLFLAGKAPADCLRIIRRVHPDVVFGAGGYVSGPMLLAARAARVPAALLEVDAHMGLANRLAVPLVERVYLAFPIPGRDGGKYLVTGRPVPQHGAISATVDRSAGAGVRWQPGLEPAQRAGGRRLGGDDPGFWVLHVTGEREYPQYADRRTRWYQVVGFTPQLWHALSRVRLVVARAGGSVFEIAAAGQALHPDPVAQRHRRPPDGQRTAPRGGRRGGGDPRGGAGRGPARRGGARPARRPRPPAGDGRGRPPLGAPAGRL